MRQNCRMTQSKNRHLLRVSRSKGAGFVSYGGRCRHFCDEARKETSHTSVDIRDVLERGDTIGILPPSKHAAKRRP